MRSGISTTMASDRAASVSASIFRSTEVFPLPRYPFNKSAEFRPKRRASSSASLARRSTASRPANVLGVAGWPGTYGFTLGNNLFCYITLYN